MASQSSHSATQMTCMQHSLYTQYKLTTSSFLFLDLVVQSSEGGGGEKYRTC